MDINKILVPVITVLLIAVVVEGAVLITENNGNPSTVPYNENELIQKIEAAKTGGTIYLVDGSYYTMPSNTLVDITNGIVHLSKGSSNYYIPLPSISHVVITK